jgi:DMSO/TMAO reductase YedYZ molybdopterin-dependent catalytic subunit
VISSRRDSIPPFPSGRETGFSSIKTTTSIEMARSNPSGIGLAVGFGRTATRDERAGTGPPPKLSNAREKPVTDRRSAVQRALAVCRFTFHFSRFNLSPVS